MTSESILLVHLSLQSEMGCCAAADAVIAAMNKIV